MVELLDLPDEMILAIMNQVKSRVELLCYMIGIGNRRLEHLTLDRCHSIDFTFNNNCSPQESLIRRFYSDVMPRIYNHIRSLTINLKNLSSIVAATRTSGNGTLPSLIHLKIIRDWRHPKTDTPITTSSYHNKKLRRFVLFSIVPQLYYAHDKITEGFLSFFRHSPLMRSLVSFEFDEYCALPVPSNDNELFFAQSPHLTHVHVILRQFDDCVRLLSQIGSQVCSFTVSLVHIRECQDATRSLLRSIVCPNLREFTLTIYRNILHYEESIIPLLQRLSNIEHLTLLLAIGVNGIGPNHFVDGFHLQRDIVSYMPHLCQFAFHIRCILRQAPHLELDTIRQSFFEQQNQVDCVLDYFNNHYGQCQIYSLPFIGTRLDYISNRFPLFDIKNRFANVNKLLLFDDIKPFESSLFERVARALSRLQTLEVSNELEQQEATTNSIEFAHLTTLILFDIHMNYADQLLCGTRLPRLVELIIRHEPLLTIIAQDQPQARGNCSKIETLRMPESCVEPTIAFRNFFPSFDVKNL